MKFLAITPRDDVIIIANFRRNELAFFKKISFSYKADITLLLVQIYR
jgi:hypothetical protein